MIVSQETFDAILKAAAAASQGVIKATTDTFTDKVVMGEVFVRSNRGKPWHVQYVWDRATDAIRLTDPYGGTKALSWFYKNLREGLSEAIKK